jgi:hypothetical protein
MRRMHENLKDMFKKSSVHNVKAYPIENMFVPSFLR